MLIRRGTTDDRDAVFVFTNLLSLRDKIARETFDEVFTAALANRNTVLLVAEDASGAAVAYLLGVVAPMFVYAGGMGFVQELYVAPHARRAGLGSALMSEFANVARAAGATMIALVTSRAAAFYEALGFTGGATYFTAPSTLGAS
jgi:ribosomal protein S18 acetylase RimI-like enzyme